MFEIKKNILLVTELETRTVQSIEQRSRSKYANETLLYLCVNKANRNTAAGVV